MAIILESTDLVKSYSGRRVLESGRLCFKEDEITAVCGPNGAGKSTLLRILALLEHPDQGRVTYKGRPLKNHGDWFQARREITMVRQNPYAFHGSVFYNTAFGLKVRGAADSEVAARVAEALSRVGLSGFEKRRAATLSGGELQRMAIARAIVCDPRVLILDEPTAHVDAERVREVEDLVLSLRAGKGMTIILASHDHDQACRLADRVLRMENGKIEEDGARIMEGRLIREEGRLSIQIEDSWSGPGQAQIMGLELSGEHVLVRLSSGLPLVRVIRKDAQELKPHPGEKIKIC